MRLTSFLDVPFGAVYENHVTYPEILVPNPAVETIGSEVFVVRTVPAGGATELNRETFSPTPSRLPISPSSAFTSARPTTAKNARPNAVRTAISHPAAIPEPEAGCYEPG